MPRKQVTDTEALAQARQTQTLPYDVQRLATHQNAKVRAAALANPNLDSDLKDLLIRAETAGEVIQSELEWLITLGPYGKKLAARHPATPITTLRRLLKEGYLQDIYDARRSRGADWLLQLAGDDQALLKLLADSRATPSSIHRKVKELLKKVSAAQVPVDTTPPSIPSPLQSPTVQHLQAKLRLKQVVPELSPEELLLLQTNLRLQRLAARHPALPLALLCWLDTLQPDGVIHEQLLERLKKDDLEPDIVERFAHSPKWEERAALACNPHLLLKWLRVLVTDEDWWVRASVAENPKAVPLMLAELAKDQKHVVIREQVAAHPHTPPDILRALLTLPDRQIRLRLARNSGTPPDALGQLSADPSATVREAVAAHPLTPEVILGVLARDPQERVREVARLRLGQGRLSSRLPSVLPRRRAVRLALASRANLPPALSESLLTDRNPDVRAQMGMQPNLTPQERAQLIQDRSLHVRVVALAHDPGVQAEVLARMPRYDVRVRRGLSHHALTPPPILEALSDDPLDDVRLAVVLHPAAPFGALRRRLPEQLLRPLIRQHPHYGGVRSELQALEEREAAQPDTPPEMLSALAESDSASVRALVARHPQTPQETLLELSGDTELAVLKALLKRKQLGFALQQALARQAEPKIKLQLLRRPDLDPSILLTLIQTQAAEELMLAVLAHPKITAEMLRPLTTHPSAVIKQALIQHPLVTSELLIKLASDQDAVVRLALLHSDCCTPAVLRRLAEYPEHRLAAAQHPASDGALLEDLSYDAHYAQTLRYAEWTQRLSEVWQRRLPLRRWLEWRRANASQRAFRDLNVLVAVAVHPNATPKALQWVRRLRHPELLGALQRRSTGERSVKEKL